MWSTELLWMPRLGATCMSRTATVKDVYRAPAFWKAYFWDEFEDDGDVWDEPAHEELCRADGAPLDRFPKSRDELEVVLPGGYSLHLKVDRPREGPQLYLRWGDQEHRLAAQSPRGSWDQVLRWEELELICRYAAEQQRSIDPRLALLLLYRFAALSDDDNVAGVFDNLRAAWQKLNVLPKDRVERLLRWCDGRARHLEWRQNANVGWTLYEHSSWAIRRSGGEGLPTARTPEQRFPFEPFNEMLNQVRRAVQAW